MICTQLGYTQRRVSLYYDSTWALNSKAQASYFRNTWLDTSYFVFLGPVMDFYVSGQVAMKGKYVGGKKAETFTFYYPDGQKQMEGKFENNKMIGIWEYFYPNGNHKQTIEFTHNDFKVQSYHDPGGTEKVKNGNGLWEGNYYSPENKDTIYITGMVINGFRDDWWTYYNKRGYTIYEEKYKEGEFKVGKQYSTMGKYVSKSRRPIGKAIFLPYKIAYTEKFMYAPEVKQSDYPYLGFLPDEVKLYFDKNWEPCDKEEAYFYRNTNEINKEGASGIITDYYINGEMYRKGRFINGQKDGEFTYYHENGVLEAQGRFDSNEKVGEWEYYYEDQSPRQIVFFEDKQLFVYKYWDAQGRLKVDEGNGKYEAYNQYISVELKETGKFVDYKKDGLWKGFTQDGRLYYEEVYKEGELIEAHSFNGEGDTITYQQRLEKAEPGEGLNAFYQFVGKNMEYPLYARRNNIQGKVLVKFTIDKEGNLIEAKAISSPNHYLSEEAERVVNQYDKWKAGKEMGKAVKMYFILPITFSLSGSIISTFN
jgi:TonB family protein